MVIRPHWRRCIPLPHIDVGADRRIRPRRRRRIQRRTSLPCIHNHAGMLLSSHLYHLVILSSCHLVRGRGSLVSRKTLRPHHNRGGASAVYTVDALSAHSTITS